MAAGRDKWISIMIVPEDGAGMRKWRVTSKRYLLFKAGFWFMSVFLVVGLISMVLSIVLYSKVRYYKTYNTQLVEATGKLNNVASRLDRYEEKEKKLRTMLGGDLELPEAVAVDASELEDDKTTSADAGSANELEKAISAEEARLRRLPTMWPVEAWQISSTFKMTGDPRTDHQGIDILAPMKTGVAASADGKVIFADTDERYGNLVVIDHGNGWQTKYGHLESMLVKPGAVVSRGSLIGVFGGSGGETTGPHLHFAMFYKGQPVDPLVWLEEKPLLNIAKNSG